MNPIPAANRDVRLLMALDGDGHDDRCSPVRTLAQLDFPDRFTAPGMNGEVADLLEAQLEGQLGTGNIKLSDVVGEVDSIEQWMVFGFTVGVVKPHDHADGACGCALGTPAADSAEEVDGPGGSIAGQLDHLRHLGGKVAVGTIEHDDIRDRVSAGVDQLEGNSLEGLGLPVREYKALKP